MDLPHQQHGIYSFGSFRLDPVRRTLVRGDEAVALSARLFDTLLYLVQNHGRLVTRIELEQAIWRGRAMEEGNLAQAISSVRKTLQSGGPAEALIVTIPNQGFRFSVPVSFETATPDALARPAAVVPGRRGKAVAAALCLGLGIAAALVVAWPRSGSGRWEAPSDGIFSIIVMPFHSFSADPPKQALAEGVSEDLTIALGRIPGSRVIGRATAETFRDRVVTAAELARTLHVHYRLDGSVNFEGGVTQVNAALTEISTGEQVWPMRFDLTCDCQVPQTEEAIVNRIASALRFEVVQIATRHLANRTPSDATAIDLCFEARAILNGDFSSGGLTRARRLLEMAVDRQPDSAEALGELGRVLVEQADAAEAAVDDAMANHVRARQVIARALTLAPDNTTALEARARLLATESNCSGASAIYDAALKNDANDVEARSGEADCALAAGKPEAASMLLQQAMDLDPLNPRITKWYDRMAEASLMLSHPLACLDWLRRSGWVELDGSPNLPSLGRAEFLSLYLIAALEISGDHGRAMRTYSTYTSLWPHRSVWRMAGYFDRGEAQGPGFATFLEALQHAGMPVRADENASDPVNDAAPGDGDFDASPRSLPGAQVVTTEEVRQRYRNGSALIVDISRGAGAIHGAIWRPQQAMSGDPVEIMSAEVLKRSPPDAHRPVVVSGDGVYGNGSYSLAKRLVALGYSNVMWYRAGDEAWSAANLEADDNRLQ